MFHLLCINLSAPRPENRQEKTAPIAIGAVFKGCGVPDFDNEQIHQAHPAVPITSEVIIPHGRRAFQADFIAEKLRGLIPPAQKACQAGFSRKR